MIGWLIFAAFWAVGLLALLCWPRRRPDNPWQCIERVADAYRWIA